MFIRISKCCIQVPSSHSVLRRPFFTSGKCENDCFLNKTAKLARVDNRREDVISDQIFSFYSRGRDSQMALPKAKLMRPTMPPTTFAGEYLEEYFRKVEGKGKMEDRHGRNGKVRFRLAGNETYSSTTEESYDTIFVCLAEIAYLDSHTCIHMHTYKQESTITAGRYNLDTDHIDRFR